MRDFGRVRGVNSFDVIFLFCVINESAKLLRNQLCVLTYLLSLSVLLPLLPHFSQFAFFFFFNPSNPLPYLKRYPQLHTFPTRLSQLYCTTTTTSTPTYKCAFIPGCGGEGTRGRVAAAPTAGPEGGRLLLLLLVGEGAASVVVVVVVEEGGCCWNCCRILWRSRSVSVRKSVMLSWVACRVDCRVRSQDPWHDIPHPTKIVH